MKKLILLAVCFMVIAGLIAVGCGSDETTAAAGVATTAGSEENAGPSTTAASGEPIVIKLTFASEKPPTHLDMTDNFPGFFDMVSEATGGKYVFKIEWFPVNTILAPADIYDGVKTGVVDCWQSSMGYNPRQFPVMQTMMQPGVSPPKNTTAMNAAGMALLAKYQPAELSDNHIFFLYACGPGWLHADFPIETVDQLNGLRIRCSGTSTRAIQLVGGDPIAMPMADVYEAAQKGTIDALVSPAETLEGWKHAELFDYSTFMNQIYASDFMWVAMNLDKWNSLPDDLKEAFDSVAVDASLRAGAIWDYAHNHAIEVSEAIGHQMVYLPEAEQAKLVDMVKPVREEYLAYLNDLGLPGEQIIADCVSIMADANARDYESWQPGE
jgi:TRAP-type C4-dicarboxylate transport system substrate-binding protein